MGRKTSSGPIEEEPHFAIVDTLYQLFIPVNLQQFPLDIQKVQIKIGKIFRSFESLTSKKMKGFCFTGKNVTVGYVQIEAGNMMLIKRKSLGGLLGEQASTILRFDS